jgi:hypothetical protein
MKTDERRIRTYKREKYKNLKASCIHVIHALKGKLKQTNPKK